MPSVPATLTYPFDPTGKYLSNKIVGEQQIITGAGFRDFHFIVPKFAPFYAESLKVYLKDLQGVARLLVEGIDYYCTHWFISASRACAAPIYGSIGFLDTTLTGVVTLDYQTLGGIWTLDEAAIAEILANSLANPRITAWDVVANLPIAFPPIDHEWDLVDMVGSSEIVAKLSEIETAMRLKGAGGLADHMADTDNPHGVTKAQVGLSLLSNYALATDVQAIAGTSKTAYMTPWSTYQALKKLAIDPLSTHVGDTANPHKTSASQVGAYSTSETDTKLSAKLDKTAAAADTLKFDGKNPDEFKDWILGGTSANSTKFGGYTPTEFKTWILDGAGAIATQFGDYTATEFNTLAQDITDHLDNILNPHGTTAAQVGAYTKTEVDDLLAKKLATTAKAADSSKLGGKTLIEVIDSVTTSISDGGTYVTKAEFETTLTSLLAAFDNLTSQITPPPAG